MIRSVKQKVVWMVALIILWEFLARAQVFNPQLLPAFSKVMIRLVKALISGQLIQQLVQSLGFVIAGVGLGLVIAFLMAVCAYYSGWLRSLLDLMCGLLHPLPGVALLPVVILWSGVGGQAVFTVILHAVVWSQYLSLLSGFDHVEEAYIEAAQNNGASGWQLIRHVLVPMSYPAILNGLKVGWSRGWRALISAEMIFGAISSIGGIGWFMYERRAFMDTTGLFAGMVLVALVGVLVEGLIFGHFLKGRYDTQ